MYFLSIFSHDRTTFRTETVLIKRKSDAVLCDEKFYSLHIQLLSSEKKKAVENITVQKSDDRSSYEKSHP